mmetsp:Transcript_38614/g.99150  ORF Transcript_38614/g.99150 Transcript_38614/m.99150 type:complete len:418 (-) Transcript_38614:191-1444(-)
MDPEELIKRNQAASLKDRYELKGKIGEGTYGVVFLAKIKGGNDQVAIKNFKMPQTGEGISITAVREVSLLRELKHDNIVNLRDVIVSRNNDNPLSPSMTNLSLVFDYAEHDLYDMIKFHAEYLNHAALSDHFLRACLYQLLSGLRYLHANWVTHRDLKPSNILVTAKQRGSQPAGQVKIADFGLARICRSPLRELRHDGVVVTIWYRAPELLLGATTYTRAVDVWALGCIFAEMIIGDALFKGDEAQATNLHQPPIQYDQLEKIFQVLGTPREQEWKDLKKLQHWPSVQTHLTKVYTDQLDDILRGLKTRKPGMYDILTKMLKYDPKERITAEEALQHELFRGIDMKDLESVFHPHEHLYDAKAALASGKNFPPHIRQHLENSTYPLRHVSALDNDQKRRSGKVDESSRVAKRVKAE